MDKNELLKIIDKAKRENATSLNLSGNKLRELPIELCNLTSLTSLDLSGNQLRALPSELCNLTSLISLNLRVNQLRALPIELCNLTSLTSLDLSGNNLSKFPIELGSLASLTSLNLSGNKLSKFPIEIGSLTSLTLLDLSGNKLREFPIELGNLLSLTSLFLNNNPVYKKLPPEVVDGGSKAIINYYRELLEKGKEKQYRAKLIFVGEGGVGKTCTLNQLQGNGFIKNSETTHGIDISIDELKYEHPNEKDVTIELSTWDFGGQRVYRGTQQLFFTKRSLYIVCWDARKGPVQCEIDFWLRTINSLAPDCPIILLATHIDERLPDINVEKYIDKYPQLVTDHAVSNSEDTGIPELTETIREIAAGMPHMGEPWPSNWLKLRDELRTFQDKYHHINKKEYKELCVKRKVEGQSFETLTDWLHDLGEILYFYKSAGLDDIIILQPEWITKAISSIFEDEITVNAFGVLDHNRLAEIWKEHDKDLHPIFLRLMEKFDLSYRIEGTSSSLVAELLPFKPPAFDWPDTNKLIKPDCQLTMKFELNFVPAGVMTWFIVRTHRFTAGKHWRDGVYLEHDKHRARAELDEDKRVFTLEVRGIMPHYFFSILKDSVDFILKRFPGLKIKRKIPCICHEFKNENDNCLWNYSYENLISRHEAQKEYAECQISYEQVALHRLLFGIHPSTIDEVKKMLEQHDRKSDLRYLHMSNLIVREFVRLNNFHMSKLEADCPSLLTITPRDSGVLQSVKDSEKSLFSTSYDVQLWCQMPGCCHPVNGGDFVLKEPNKWLVNIAPWLKILIESIKYIEMVTAITQGFVSQAVASEAKDKIKTMEKLMNIIPNSDSSHRREIITDDYMSSSKISGAELRVVHELLNHLDISHYWGGLRKILSPEGDILWLCKKHYHEFDPGLPDLN